MTPLKLGEEAVVLLDAFTLQGTHHKTLRQSYHRARREGLSFAVLDRQAVQTHLEDLAGISNAWLSLKSTREKEFSLGRFDPEYLRRFEIAIALFNDKPVAFANLLTTMLQCFYGIDDDEVSLCTSEDMRGAENIELPGDHHFDQRYAPIADRIMEGIARRSVRP